MEARNNEIKISTDAMIALVVTEAMERELASMPSFEEMNNAFQPSEQFTRKMEKLFRSSRNKQRFKKWQKVIKRVVICAAMLLSAFSCMMMPVKAVRDAVITTLMDWQEKYVSITIIRENREFIPIPDTIELAYIPDGFTVQESRYRENQSYSVIYTDGTRSFIVEISAIDKSKNILVDNEETSFYSIRFNAHEALWGASEGGYNTLIWEENGLFWHIAGSIELNQLIEISDNICF